MATTTTGAELYRRWLEEVWNGDLQEVPRAAERLVAPDFVGHWPGRPALVRGPAALAEVVRQGRLPFEELRFDAEVGPVEGEDLVAARWVARGRYAGGEYALPGATAAPGSAIEFHGHDILRLADGRAAEYWVISETEQLQDQLSRPAS